MIKKIGFNKKAPLFSDYLLDGKEMLALEGVSKINFLVGANNSGKSRFLRLIAKQFSDYQAPKFENRILFPGESKEPITLTHVEATSVKSRFGLILEELKGISQEWHDQWLEVFKESGELDESDIAAIYNKFSLLTSHPYSRKSLSKEQIDALQKLKERIKGALDSLCVITPGHVMKVTYVPALRSLRKFKIYNKENFPYRTGPIKQEDFKDIAAPILATRGFIDHFIDKVIDDSSVDKAYIDVVGMPFNDIFSGEELFDKIRELRVGTEDKREILNGFEDFLSRMFFNGQRVELNAIKVEGLREIHVKIGKEKEYPIQNLGDGIQSIIILVFPLFYNQNLFPHIVLYEEPELYLHPGMQRIFVEALKSFKNVTAFVVTHSNHILDTAFDYKKLVSIFSFEKKLDSNIAAFNIRSMSSPDISLLNLLGVRNSSVFLSNCCVWVEGISDRIYLKKYLSLYMDGPKKDATPFFEDLHFSFLEFGGNQVVHFDFSGGNIDNASGDRINALRITNRMMLIHDNDEGKDKRHNHFSEQLGDNYVRLPVREIENLLCVKLVEKILNRYRRKDTEHIKLTDFGGQGYVAEPFGVFLEGFEKTGQLKKLTVRSSAKAKPTIGNKADFALTAVSYMSSWEDLSAEAQELTKKVYAFISGNLVN